MTAKLQAIEEALVEDAMAVPLQREAIIINLNKLNKDVRLAANTLHKDEVRFLVSSYYAIQQNRIRLAHQRRTLEFDRKPHEILEWLFVQARTLEDELKKALAAYSNSDEIGAWMQSIVGIGPIISAGILAHVDITQAPTAGHIMAFGGLDPTKEWKKGEKRPWNAELKTLFWKLGESFVKFQNNPNDVYGKLYAKRKAEEARRNEAGEYADQAAQWLTRMNFGRATDARKWYTGEWVWDPQLNKDQYNETYEMVRGTKKERGDRTMELIARLKPRPMLPPRHIHSRARRWAVKIFISNLHEVWFQYHYKKPAPAPYPFAHLGHVHKIDPPGM